MHLQIDRVLAGHDETEMFIQAACRVVGLDVEANRFPQPVGLIDQAGEEEAGILAVHRMILEDPGASSTVECTVREERINAEVAVQNLIDDLHKKMERLEGASVRQYAADVSEPWKVVLDVLMKRDQEQLGAGAIGAYVGARIAQCDGRAKWHGKLAIDDAFGLAFVL